MRFISRRAFAVAVVAIAATACGQKGKAQGQGETAAAPAPEISPAAKAAQAFMDKNAKEAGVMTTASGLQYKVVKSGPADGVKPGPRDEVKVNYSGSLTTGQIFDSTDKSGAPAVFPVDGVIPGWTEALQLMHPGDVWDVFVPPKLGYGARNMGPIPADSVLVFRMELLGVLKAGPANA